MINTILIVTVSSLAVLGCFLYLYITSKNHIQKLIKELKIGDLYTSDDLNSNPFNEHLVKILDIKTNHAGQVWVKYANWIESNINYSSSHIEGNIYTCPAEKFVMKFNKINR